MYYELYLPLSHYWMHVHLAKSLQWWRLLHIQRVLRNMFHLALLSIMKFTALANRNQILCVLEN